MEVMSLFFLVASVLVLLFFLFKLTKWVFSNEKRKVWVISTITLFTLVMIINRIFFRRMELIPSKIYPNLYLVKNPIRDNDSLKSFMLKVIAQKLGNQLICCDSKYVMEPTTTLDYSIHFYKYYKGWGFSPFGAAGTAHFVENAEDPGGFSSELLEHYDHYIIALFHLKKRGKDTMINYGLLTYFKDGDPIKSDTIFNLCNITK